MARRIVLLLALGVALAAIPTASAAGPVASAVSPITRLLCGCDLQSAARQTITAFGSRVSTVSMSIVHVVRGCHVWALRGKQLGPSTIIEVKPGTRLKLRIDCPMDFDLKQVAGPRLALGNPRFVAGTTRVLTFRKAGVYKLVGRNVQTPAEVGLVTLGADNVVRLTIRVK